MKKILLFHLLLVCPVIFLLWYIAYPNYIWFLEGNSFFSTIPDFTEIQLSLPSDWAGYSGAYLLQFFCNRIGGALIQTLFVAVVLLSADFIIISLFHNKGLLWLSFIPVVWFISGQFVDSTLVRSLWWCAVAIISALLVWGVTFRLKKRSWGERSFFSSPFFSYIVPCCLLGVSMYYEVTDNKQKELEAISQLDRWAEHKNWDAILQKVTPEMTRQSSVKLHWVLLALSEKGLLTERMFAYGVTDPACFFYEHKDWQFAHDFNVRFYEALGLDNEVIHYAFQSGVQSPYGMNFRSMRSIMNACMRQGYNRMLAKYVDVMKHTSCYRKRMNIPVDYLASVGGKDRPESERDVHPFFIGAHSFLSDMARLVDRCPDHRKAIDYLLCGLLISKDINKFYQVLTTIYPSSSSKLPRYYEEALIVMATQHPEVLRRFPVEAAKVKEFNSFQSLLKEGVMGQGMLEVNYRDSFWFYYYCTQVVRK